MKKIFNSIVLSLGVLLSSSAFAWDFNNTNPAVVTGAIGGIGGILSAFSAQSNEPYGRSGGDYSRNETLRGGDVEDAVVLMVREVRQESTNTASTVGTAAGGAIGGIAGASVGKGNVSYVTGILGAVAGAAIGQSVGRYASERKAGEVLVQLPNGVRTFVVQEDGLQFQPGQRVFIFGTKSASYGSSQNLRIVPNTSGITARR